jgi:NADH:ubiquinone oxidoreductase subunit 4 (subunit M)
MLVLLDLLHLLFHTHLIHLYFQELSLQIEFLIFSAQDLLQLFIFFELALLPIIMNALQHFHNIT